MNELTPKTIGIGIVAIIVSVAALFGIWKLTSKPAVQTKVSIELSRDDHKIGSDSAKLTLIEYSDFQCPACKAYQSMVKQVVEKYKDRLLFVYRHFPLQQHKNAQAAALASEAAANQNQFWQMHDKLFKEQDEWANSAKPNETFIRYANDLKLDIEKFKRDLDSDKAKNKIKSDQESGVSFGVNSTPSFFLNGKKLDNPRSVEEFEKLINREANKK